ncbi:hypothetical protein V8V80_10800 [Niallia taxi]
MFLGLVFLILLEETIVFSVKRYLNGPGKWELMLKHQIMSIRRKKRPENHAA